MKIRHFFCCGTICIKLDFMDVYNSMVLPLCSTTADSCALLGTDGGEDILPFPLLQASILNIWQNSRAEIYWELITSMSCEDDSSILNCERSPSCRVFTDLSLLANGCSAKILPLRTTFVVLTATTTALLYF